MLVPCGVAVHVFRQHRATRLFELQEDHVVGTAPFQQGHVRPQTHAADANDLVRDIDERVAAERAPPVRRERMKVVVERLPTDWYS